MIRKRRYSIYVLFVLAVLPVWAIYLYGAQGFEVLWANAWVMLTMVFGSMVAGSSAVGGGAVAYPVLTLLLDVSPEVARNFSFAVQSIGMTAASLLILGLRIPVERTTIKVATLGSLLGLAIGTYLLASGMVSFRPSIVKIFFVSLWLSFGIALFVINKNKERSVHETLQLNKWSDYAKLTGFGIVGGLVTALLGNGVDIILFCLLTLHYNLSEKVATPTSVILMTINTIAGFLIHAFVVQDFGVQEFSYWLACIPVVIFGAPLGAYLISRWSRKTISNILYTIILVQYVGAIWVIQFDRMQYLYSFSIVIIGLSIFYIFTSDLPRFLLPKKRKKQLSTLAGQEQHNHH